MLNNVHIDGPVSLRNIHVIRIFFQKKCRSGRYCSFMKITKDCNLTCKICMSSGTYENRYYVLLEILCNDPPPPQKKGKGWKLLPLVHSLGIWYNASIVFGALWVLFHAQSVPVSSSLDVEMTLFRKKENNLHFDMKFCKSICCKLLVLMLPF